MTNPFKSRRIGVLMGGISSEREISLRTGAGVHRALLDRGYGAVALDWKEGEDLAARLRAERVEVVWNALHGTYGEDGCVQGLLECLRIPYTGSGVLGSALAMDKVLSKTVFEKVGIRTPPWKVIPPGEDAAAAARAFGWPVVVKPSREGSTVGVSIVRAAEGLPAAVELAARHHGVVMVEPFIPGREASVAILDDAVLGTVEIRPRSGFYDYDAKYLSGDTEYLVPAPFAPGVDREAREASLAAHRALGCSGHSRVDLRVEESGAVWVLEVNTLPGLTETSLLPKIGRHAGIDYAALVERILVSARVGA
jgi:D-alanine-D-alanine ligase